MKVKDLLEMLKDADPEMPIVVSGSDHSYDVARAEIITARYVADWLHWSEDWKGDLDAQEERKQVLFVG